MPFLKEPSLIKKIWHNQFKLFKLLIEIIHDSDQFPLAIDSLRL